MALPILIEPKELFALIQQNPDRDYCIVDLSSEAEYLNGHIPGAVFLPYAALLCNQAPVPGKLASTEQLQRVFSYLGMTANTHFIAYDSEGGGWAGRFIWTLDVIGHRHYSVIDGGTIAWRSENLPMETTQNAREETEVHLQIHREAIAEKDDVLKALNSNTLIWDARSPEEYAGIRVNAAKGGHIPGARNCEWTDLMDHNNGYRLRKDARDYLRSMGIDGEQAIITHCQSHHRSAYTYLVGKILGFSIRGYHGSWAEWGNDPSTPVEK